MSLRWYVSRNGETSGPVDEADVASWIRAGMHDASVREENGGAWMPLSQSPFKALLPNKAIRVVCALLGLVLVGLLVEPLLHTRSPVSAPRIATETPAPAVIPEERNRAEVECSGGGESGVLCSLKHVSGREALDVSWNISLECANGLRGKAHGHGVVEPNAHMTVIVPYSAFPKHLAKCDALTSSAVTDLVISTP